MHVCTYKCIHTHTHIQGDCMYGLLLDIVLILLKFRLQKCMGIMAQSMDTQNIETVATKHFHNYK